MIYLTKLLTIKMCSDKIPIGIPDVLDVIFDKNWDIFYSFYDAIHDSIHDKFDQKPNKNSNIRYDKHVIVNNNIMG